MIFRGFARWDFSGGKLLTADGSASLTLSACGRETKLHTLKSLFWTFKSSFKPSSWFCFLENIFTSQRAWCWITAAVWTQQARHEIPSHPPNIGTFLSFYLRLCPAVINDVCGCSDSVALREAPFFTQLIRSLPLLAPAERHLWPVTPLAAGGHQRCLGTSTRPHFTCLSPVCDLSGSDRSDCECWSVTWMPFFENQKHSHESSSEKSGVL